MDSITNQHIYSVYFAPRGRERLMRLGERLAHQHLNYEDRLIGIIGDSGSGKSLVIKGLFPGVALSNDDDLIAMEKVMQVRPADLDHDFKTATYHIDMRFQMAFTQMYEIVDFVKGALGAGRRVIVEHFDLLYPFLKINADIIIGIGEEIIVTRPTLFGPLPRDIFNLVIPSLRKRKMAHTAEDLTAYVLQEISRIPFRSFKDVNSDIRGGFVLNFPLKLEVDLAEVERHVQGLLDQQLDISYYDEDHIQIGENIVIPCTGPRIHVRNTSEIEHFQLIKEFKHDPKSGRYALVGIIDKRKADGEDFNEIHREQDD
ncbi:MAG: alanine-tRNA synthetase second additional domain-containing protein [Candidatus Adiutrix sp.]|nr:alanine-tRNA synthetase second additional domain-containing protein [Candidatus Adiutrix sp.]